MTDRLHHLEEIFPDLAAAGNLEDIIHRTHQAVAGPDPAYGQVACFMKCRRARDTDVKAAKPQEDKPAG
jgi:hypothetical protein